MRAPRFTALAGAAVFAITLAACSDDGEKKDAAAPAPTTAGAASAASAAVGQNAAFGTGCSAVPADPSNAGSFAAMAKKPVATAAAANPQLSTLVSAVKTAGLTKSLNSADGVTVFAPVNDAFAKIPAADLKRTLADKRTLAGILTYHLVPGRLTPANLAGGHPTVQGQNLTITGSGANFTVNDTATVLCGNVQTANATVYLIDTVLVPKPDPAPKG